MKGETRTNPYLGRIEVVHLYPAEGLPPMRMLEVPHSPEGVQPGQFAFDGKHIYFHDKDRKSKKFIAYQSITQVQRDVKGSTKVRLRP